MQPEKEEGAPGPRNWGGGSGFRYGLQLKMGEHRAGWGGEGVGPPAPSLGPTSPVPELPPITSIRTVSPPAHEERVLRSAKYTFVSQFM